MLGRNDAVGGAEQRVRPGGEHGQLAVAGGERKADLGAIGAADPVALHCLHALGPIERIQVIQQAVGIGGDPQHPLAHQATDDRIPGLDVLAVLHLLVGEHRVLRRAPVDRHFRLVGQATFVELEENPLRPADEIGGSVVASSRAQS